MTQLVLNPEVDSFILNEGKWKREFEELRRIILECELTEEVKWGVPCYTHDDKNIVLMHGFKEYCALLFVKGVLLKDPEGVLVSQTENVQSARQIRFKGFDEIVRMEKTIRTYVDEAIEIEKSGKKVRFKDQTDFNIPVELQEKFDDNVLLKTAFEALTPGRQRAYVLYFSEPKKKETRRSRIDKHVQRILNGKGLRD